MRARTLLRLLAVTVSIGVLAGCAAMPSPMAGSAVPRPTSAAPTPTPTPTPTPSPTPPTPREIAADLVAGMTLRDRVASLLVFHVPGTDGTAAAAFVAANRPGGLIFMHDNVGTSVTDVAALATAVQAASPTTTIAPMLLAVDQEGGDVSRLPGDVWAAGKALHDVPTTATSDAFGARAQLVASAGLNLNFGIVADVSPDGSSFIFRRTLGVTPQIAGEHVAAAVAAERAEGVLSTLKHFPGHGAAPGDSHVTVPTTDMPYDAWLASDAVPFRAGIDAGAEVVMLGHLRFAAVDPAPTSMSSRWQQILRDDLGFDGVIITDDMGMLENAGDPAYADRVTNAVAALQAGVTMLLFVADGPVVTTPAQVIDGIVAAVADGRLAESVVDDAAARALELRLSLVP